MSDAPRVLVLLGSGETAPAMRALQARLLSRVPADRPRLLLETTYGFQPNVSEMTAKLQEWFAVNVGSPLEAAGLARLDGPDSLGRERGLARVAEAGYLLAGPGSPSFALRQWLGSPLPGRMEAMLREGGTVVLASAAAVTVGAFSLPVYEIYKAGEDPSWLPGLDLLAPWGIRAAIVPHYDNAEGGGHDTRFCYMGEQRIGLLESLLPGDAWVIGIDEQTAVVIDLEEQTAAVSGKGGVTVRHGGVSRGIDHGATVPLAALVPDAMDATRPAPLRSPVKTEDTQLTFREAVAAGDLDRAASIALAAVDAEDPAALRSMIAALADVATARPAFDPVEVADPFVRALLDIRTAVRSEKRWDLSDLIRDRLAAVSIVVRDTPDGPTWEFA